MQSTLPQNKSVLPLVIVVLILLALAFVSVVPYLQSSVFSTGTVNQPMMVRQFKPGKSTAGVRPSDTTAPGYSPTSLEYQISVEGDKSCTGISIGLRMTGYGWQRKKIDECTHGAILTTLEELIENIRQKLRGNNSEAQNGIEDKLIDDFLWDLPEITSTLR